MTSMLDLLPAYLRYKVSVSVNIARDRLQGSLMIAGPPTANMNVPRVVAVHFPKAGGTSLVQQFGAVLKSQLAMDYSGDPLAGTSGTRAFPAGKSMVIGHFRPDRYDGADAFRMTVLRHPVANLISKYYYWKTVPDRGHPIHHRFLQEQPSLIDFAGDRRIKYLMSQTYFGGYDMARFDFIGFHETRANDLQVLSRLLGIPISAEVHINRTPCSDEYSAARNDHALRSALTDILVADIAFYDRLRASAVGR